MKRRTVHFANFEDVLDDVDRLHRDGYTQVGNWSLGQMCNHMAMGVDTISKSWIPKWFQRIGVFCFVQLAFLGKIGNALGLRAPAGAKLAQNEPVDDAVGIDRLEAALARLIEEPDDPIIPFHLMHCEHHLSFLIRKTD